MGDDTSIALDDLRTFATWDAHGGKVSRRVEVLEAPGDDGLVAVADGTVVRRVEPGSLRDWYHPDLVVIARSEGPEPGLYADTRTRGRVRIADLEGHLGPDGRPAFRALTGSGEEPTLDAPLPREEAVRLVAVQERDGDAVSVVSLPVRHLLSPGVYPDRSRDLPGLPARSDRSSVRVRAFVVAEGERHEIERIDERAHTVWVLRDGQSTPFSVSAFGPDLVRYVAEAV
jgi:hypothetical protein